MLRLMASRASEACLLAVGEISQLGNLGFQACLNWVPEKLSWENEGTQCGTDCY